MIDQALIAKQRRSSVDRQATSVIGGPLARTPPNKAAQGDPAAAAANAAGGLGVGIPKLRQASFPVAAGTPPGGSGLVRGDHRDLMLAVETSVAAFGMVS
jgi:hypothetical protein